MLGNTAIIYQTIKFQKCGLPYIYILVIIKPSLQLVTAEDINLVIQADILDLVVEPLLYNIVTRNILYGPYSTYNTSTPYIRNRKYRFQFPYAFQEETIVRNNNKPLYKRPQDGPTFIKPRQSYIYSSRDIAPYNAYFSTRFNAYINVESYIGYYAIKYAFKYIYKGPNYTTITLGAYR